MKEDYIKIKKRKTTVYGFILEVYDMTKNSHTFLRNLENKFLFSKQTDWPISVSPWLLYLVSDLCILMPLGLNFLSLSLKAMANLFFCESLAGTPCMEEKALMK